VRRYEFRKRILNIVADGPPKASKIENKNCFRRHFEFLRLKTFFLITQIFLYEPAHF
jgi:hypothetical protein